MRLRDAHFGTVDQAEVSGVGEVGAPVQRLACRAVPGSPAAKKSPAFCALSFAGLDTTDEALRGRAVAEQPVRLVGQRVRIDGADRDAAFLVHRHVRPKERRVIGIVGPPGVASEERFGRFGGAHGPQLPERHSELQPGRLGDRRSPPQEPHGTAQMRDHQGDR